MLTDVHYYKVFITSSGEFGDPASVVIDTDKTLGSGERLKLTQEIGHAETVFVDSTEPYSVQIFDSSKEVSFAGQPMLATAAFLLDHADVDQLEILCSAGMVNVWRDGDKTWLRTTFDYLPEWNLVQLDTPEQVGQLPLDPEVEHTLFWAWIDEAKGLVRARTIAPDWNLPEVESNGSGSMKLAKQLNRELTIIHGQGSEIFARPTPQGLELGGRVIKN